MTQSSKEDTAVIWCRCHDTELSVSADPDAAVGGGGGAPELGEQEMAELMRLLAMQEGGMG